MMPSILAPIVYTIILLLVGVPLLLLLAPRDARIRAELWLPLAFALGWSLHAISAKWCLLILGILPASLLPAMAFVGILGTGAAVYTRRASTLRGFSLQNVPSSGAMLYVAIGLLILARFALLTADALRFPLFTWDGRMIWNLKAILLFHEGAVATDAFLDPLRIHFHRDYPLMLPIAYTGVYQLAGAVEERMVRLWLVILLAFFCLAMHGVSRNRATPVIAMLMTLAVASVAFRQDYGFTDGATILTGVADHPLAFIIFLAFVCMMRGWWTGRIGWFLLGGVYTGSAMLLKSEGVVVLAMAIGMNILGLLFYRRRLYFLPRILAAIGVALVIATPWLLLKATLPNFYDEKYGQLARVEHLPAIIARIPLLLELFAREFAEWRMWGFFWIVYLVGFPAGVALWRRGRRMLLDVVVVVWLVGYLLIYSISPLDLGYHVETSISRLLTHFHALALLQTGTLVGVWLRLGGLKRSAPTGAQFPAGASEKERTEG